MEPSVCIPHVKPIAVGSNGDTEFAHIHIDPVFAKAKVSEAGLAGIVLLAIAGIQA